MLKNHGKISIVPKALALLPFLLVGCKSAPAPVNPTPVATAPAASTITYPARPTIAPATFKLFHHYDGNFTLTTADKATDDQIAALVWQLRDAGRTHTFDKLHISQKDVDAGGSTVWFHIYRGVKCAPEKYADGALPCGNSYHGSGDYSLAKVNNQTWDKGSLVHDEKETLLWNPDSPYTPQANP